MSELRRHSRWLAPLIGAIVLLAIWQVYVDVANVSRFVLPSPHEVFRALIDDRGTLWHNFKVTAVEIVCGIALAAAGGLLVAVALHFSGVVRRSLYPLLVASQAIPVVILAPLLVVWLGFGLLPKLIVIALVCFFPIVVTTLAGLESVDPELIKLLRTFDAGRGQMFWRAELPSALPGLFTGAKLAAVFSVIGAVFAEQAGASSGLGELLQVTTSNLETAEAFATVFVLAAFAILLFTLLTMAERAIVAVGSPTERDTDLMRLRRFRASRRAMTAASVTLAGALIAGCGEVSNTITPPPGTANQVTVVISGQPNGFYVGLYDAEALGYFRATDMDVHILVPSAGEDPLTMLHDGRALLAIASTPTILLHRNLNEPLVGVAAIVHAPLPSISITTPSGSSGGQAVTTTTGTVTSVTTSTATTATTPPLTTSTTSTDPGTLTSPTATATTGAPAARTQTATGTGTTAAPSTTTISPPDATLWPAALQSLLKQRSAPDYDGLVIVVRKGSIVNHAGLLRRFVQAVARGYRAARRNPEAAVANLIKEVPSLASSEALALNTVNAALPYIFPAGLKIWGYQRQAEWNTLGTWMADNHLISNPNTITDASTNELLQGEGV